MSNLLRSFLGEPRPPAPPVHLWRDWTLVALVVVAGVLEGVLRTDMPLRVLSVILVVALAPLLLWRRTHPLAVVATVFGVIALTDIALLVAGARALDVNTLLFVLLLAYSLFRWGSGREVVAGLAIIAVPATLAIVVSWTGFAEAIGGVAVLFSAFALGWAVRAQHGARERWLEQVKSQERVLLARELHDTVAHHVSAIAIHAQAGRVLAATSPSASLEALEVIEVEASRTLAEMRTMVRVLRNEAPVDYAPQRGVADLELLSGASPAGPRVEVTVSGDLVALPAAIDAAVFRIAQEAVTNALRHARNATLVDVRVAGEPTTVSLVVRDDGDPGGPDPAPDAGFGLTGMVERALLLGGACQAGPCPDRGWVVSATLPREVPA
ncbi:sensor histidine kinase [Aeromicrobium senzhongii]|uniref:histidine kinase n=1 Tax=Aeromicrobium senzhongii TaxID=2663859 RepID=A0ABX6SWR0_9ACTN|nr:histidine kinase [Aeromicrobium senzhongii]MTB87292.1 sensor histidine kinase [Aeromicrobium senzhongii]QNL95642.1 sensor histidine kinase [Aeromicrobium senzhongii]